MTPAARPGLNFGKVNCANSRSFLTLGVTVGVHRCKAADVEVDESWNCNAVDNGPNVIHQFAIRNKFPIRYTVKLGISGATQPEDRETQDFCHASRRNAVYADTFHRLPAEEIAKLCRSRFWRCSALYGFGNATGQWLCGCHESRCRQSTGSHKFASVLLCHSVLPCVARHSARDLQPWNKPIVVESMCCSMITPQSK